MTHTMLYLGVQEGDGGVRVLLGHGAADAVAAHQKKFNPLRRMRELKFYFCLFFRTHSCAAAAADSVHGWLAARPRLGSW